MKQIKKKQIVILVCVVLAGIAAGSWWGLFSVMQKAASSVQPDLVQTVAKSGAKAASATLESAAEWREETFQEKEKTFFKTAWFKQLAGDEGPTEVELEQLEHFYEKLTADDIWRNESRKLHHVGFGDFDGNGQMDMIAMAGNEEDWESGGISFYFNEEPVFVYEEKGCCYSFGFWSAPFVADVDNDGNTELILEVFNGGCGGSGGKDYVYLRRVGENWEIIEEPWLWYPDDLRSPDGGFNEMDVDVRTTCISEDRYEAYCAYLDEKIVFEAENCWEPEDMKFGEMGGANSRGLGGFICTEYEGRNALQCAEYLYGEGGIAHGIGLAWFLFVWDEDGSCRLEQWWIEPI